MKVLLDMNMSERWAAFLVRFDIDAVHWSALGAADAADEQILAHAAENGFVVMTQDLDFGELLALGQLALPSVVQIRADDIRPKIMARRWLLHFVTRNASLKVVPS